jgi:DNA repair protein NreA
MAMQRSDFLERLSARMQNFKTVQYSEKLAGSSPPSVFIGRYGYPKIAAGPLLTSTHGDTAILDQPEEWIPQEKSAPEIVDFRMQLVRGKKYVGISDMQNKLVTRLQEIALSKDSLEMEAEFSKKPHGTYFHEEVQPFGPSASLKHFSIGNSKFNPQLEKAHYDTDLKAKDAVLQLYSKGVAFSSIQRAFSTGAFGINRNRKLVPTRWSITAVDSTLSDNMLNEIKSYDTIDEFRVYESESLSNRYIVIMTPQLWQYEWIEAFFPKVIGEKLEIFGDHEGFEKKKEYAACGGCYYSARLAAAEKLIQEKRQAGVVILREAYSDYIPLGVWNVRENMRAALKGECQKFSTMDDTLTYSMTRLKLSLGTWFQHSALLRQNYVQKRLSDFAA